MQINKKIITLFLSLAMSFSGMASGLCVENASLLRHSNGRLEISFDMQWENSWKNSVSYNWDGVWVFAKYRIDDNPWQPVYFESAGHIFVEKAGTPVGIEYGKTNVNNNDEIVGMFVYPKTVTNFHGSMAFESATLLWNADKHNIGADNVISVRVFAIEMVYVPTADFDIGDNANEYRLMKHGSVLYSADNNTFNWLDGKSSREVVFPKDVPDTIFDVDDNIIQINLNDTIIEDYYIGLVDGRTSLFPVTSDKNEMGYFVDEVGTVRASGMDGLDSLYGPWIPFSMRSLGNEKSDALYWETSAGQRQWHWIEFEFESGIRKKGQYIVIKSQIYSAVRPHGYYIAGSNDGIDYKVIGGYYDYTGLGDGVMGVTSTNYGVYIPIRINEPEPFNIYRFYFYSEGAMLPFVGMYDDDESVNLIDSEDQLHYLSESAPIAEEFPKGYKGFWVMKYELTQAAYVDFLNTLTYNQQSARTGKAPNLALNTRIGTGRCWIKIKSVDRDGRAVYGLNVDGNGDDWSVANNGGNLPMFNMSWADGAAYADWAGLRPLTELEYEKMSRGHVLATPGEYTWGSPLMIPVNSLAILTNPYQVDESFTSSYGQSLGNCRTSPDGTITNANYPMRVGAFANPQSSRLEAGASFYGILNLNDNVAERYVNISTPEGRSFTGLHGDGQLNGAGLANVQNWPKEDSKGTGYRGFYNNTIIPLSDRRYAETANAARNAWDGFRGGRSSTIN